MEDGGSDQEGVRAGLGGAGGRLVPCGNAL